MDRNMCVGCHKMSPAVESEFTLVGPSVGWRISRSVAPDGTYILDWRCPECWKKFRDVKAGAKGSQAPSMPPSMPPSTPPTTASSVAPASFKPSSRGRP